MANAVLVVRDCGDETLLEVIEVCPTLKTVLSLSPAEVSTRPVHSRPETDAAQPEELYGTWAAGSLVSATCLNKREWENG